MLSHRSVSFISSRLATDCILKMVAINKKKLVKYGLVGVKGFILTNVLVIPVRIRGRKHLGFARVF